MQSDFDLNDLLMTYHGDFIVKNEDLLDTFTFEEERGVVGLSLKQEIVTRLEAYSEDFQLYPDLGTNMRDYIGTYTDLEYVKQAGKNAIIRALTANSLIQPGSLEVGAFQISPQTILYIIKARIGSSFEVIGFNYDLSENLFRHIY